MIENINLNGATVSAELHGYMYKGVYGYNGVLDSGSKLSAEIVSNNEIKIKDGLLCNAGRFMRIVGSESVAIANGTSGVSRTDLIVAHFETNGITEKHDIRVIQGTADGAVPTYANDDIYNGGSVHELPLYEVHLNGLTVESLVQKFSIISTTEEIEKKLRTNFLKCTLATTTSNGITCTNNGDGTYTLNGKATSVTYFKLGDTNLTKGKYKILGCPKNANGATIHNNSPECNDTGDGGIIELTETKNIAPYIMVPNELTLTNAVFKPMITENLNAIYDDFVSSNDSFITGKAIEDKALTYEEIQASTDLTGKIASASALRTAYFHDKYIDFGSIKGLRLQTWYNPKEALIRYDGTLSGALTYSYIDNLYSIEIPADFPDMPNLIIPIGYASNGLITVVCFPGDQKKFGIAIQNDNGGGTVDTYIAGQYVYRI